ncbi:MAG: SocA family protein [Bacteroidales bacterium]|jgi:uncharacterized phage-associated protein|nr:SocA family protein [Bacteroidales bacterium]
MLENSFDIEKAKAAVLLIATNTDNPTLHKIFKILYFAEKKHLAKYGRPILKDRYIAMNYGPVPSEIFDFFDTIRGKRVFEERAESFYNAFDVYGEKQYNIKAKEQPNLDHLSKSDTECLFESIEENNLLGFKDLTEKSHDLAWNNADRDNEIDFVYMARDAGASDGMIEYIKETLELRNFCFA